MYKIVTIDPKTGRQPYRAKRRLYETRAQFDKWFKHFRKRSENICNFDIQGYELIRGKWKRVKT